ncbi:hypothetical protein IQ266_18835 [filamentous cyanobacterium LEGE 11480]|uniref:Uncharacterized protein n=1 Tax=Romeriopsis navalis LEGE 11480 TaxID=2777977 RepID=A0A928VTI5_9CYAN|nr:hypothetical protein [Romeriopsis navalis]MBE9031794.1 hypothetical protein [Romeriopsis navalis LEGE 11480]
MDRSVMAPKPKGIPTAVNVQLASIGDYYSELLVVGARTVGSTPTSYASGMIKQALAANKNRIMERVAHHAQKWECTEQEAWSRLVAGDAED